MNITRILEELKDEQRQIEAAIMSLEYLSRGRGKRRGRPPKWMAATADGRQEQPSSPAVPARRKKRSVSPEARKRMAEGQKKRWAAARKAEAPAGKE